MKPMFFQKDPSSPERDRRAASVAVAAFDPLPLDKDQARLAMGFLEDVIFELARAPDFEVLSPRTSLSLKPEELEPRRLAEAFGVTHLLDASVRPGADGLQVKANLVEALTGKVVWTRRYDAPQRAAGQVLEDIAAQVASHVSVRVRQARLAEARARPLSSLAAQECWLRGLEQLRLSTPEANEEARRLFQRALSVDPTYGRAYAGLSLSHFKRWNWRRASDAEAENDRLSLDYAAKAEALDDMDPVIQVVLGRLHVYRRDFARGAYHLQRAEELSPNEADCLMHMSPLRAYLGEAEKALALAAKAFRLNPLHEPWYYFVGFMPQFLARRFAEAAAILERSPPHMIFEQSALLAATYVHLGRVGDARAQAALYLEALRAELGREPEAGEPVQQALDANPFRRDEDRELLVEGLRAAGLAEASAPPPARAPTPSQEGRFVRRADGWELAFDGRAATVPHAKGCQDLALLLGAAGERIHCMEIAGRVAEGDAGEAMDAKARAACQRRIRELQADMAEAERHNDFARSERFGAELDGLIDQLSAAMGLGGRARRLGDPAEKARTAVTWRIRSAIRRIGKAHGALGRHLAMSVRTGAFCVYAPERPVRWALT
jgi:TolB-like protein